MKNNLKELRQQMGLTQQELANLIGTQKQYISNLETGIRNLDGIRSETLQKLCSALNCTPEDFVKEDATFEFEDGKLIFDDLYMVGNLYVVVIKGRNYLLPMVSQYCGSEKKKNTIVQHLKPYRGFVNKRMYKPIYEVICPLYDLVPRQGYNVPLGRPITDDELNEFKTEYGIKDEDMSEPFVAKKGEMYDRYAKTYTAIQFKLRNGENPFSVESKWSKKGIEISAVNPSTINVRVK